MADAAAAPAKKVAPKKKPAPKKPAAHPTYSEMVAAAVGSLKERGGSSRQAILKYIMANYKGLGDEKAVNSRLKLALKAGVKKGALKQAKGTGASGSFRLGEKPKVAKPKAKKAAKPKKVKTPKKAAKKPAAKKAAAKPKKAKTPKKAAKPAAKKAAAKPKKAAKKPAAKKPAAKKAAKK